MIPKLSRTALAYSAGAITAFVGIIVLIGWQVDSYALKTFGLGSISMKANTAACFLLAGLALVVMQRLKRFSNLIVRFLSLVIILVGILFLCQNFFGWDIGLDEFLFPEPLGAIGTSHPGLMAPNTALNFMLIGFAFFLFTFNRFRQTFLMEFTILFPLTISVIGLFGYLTGLEELAGPAAYTQMAANTAGTFIVLCLGIILTLLDRQHRPISMEQKLFAGLITSATVILFISFLSISGIKALHKEAYWVEHTQQVKNQLGNILSNVLEVQSGGRGYLLTGNEKFLLPRKEAEVNLPSLIKNLNVLIADNKEQMQKLATLETLVKQRIAFSDEIISAMRLKDKSEAYLLVATEKGNDLTNSIRMLITNMIEKEDQLLQLHSKAVNGQTIRTQIIIFLSLCLQVLLLAFIFLFVKKDVSGKRKAEKELKTLNQELEDRVKKRTAEITKLNRVYTVLSNVNQAIVRIKDKQTLYNEACRIAVEDGGFWMAWIGIVDEQTNKIMPVASAGQAEEYIKTINIDLNDKIIGEGLIGRSIKTGVHFLTNDLLNDPELIPWREKVSQLGCKSAASFPINIFGKTIGAFMLYSHEQFFFDEVEVRLLDELAMDISFAIEVNENETKRLRIENELRQSEERFRSTLDNMIEGCQILGFDWRYLYINNAADIQNKRRKEELLGNVYMEMWPGIEETKIFSTLKGSMEERMSYQLDNEFEFPDGSKGWFKISVEAVPEGILIFSEDITERKLAEEKIHQAENRFRSLIEQGNDIITLVDNDGKIKYTSPSNQVILGYTDEEYLGTSALNHVHPDDLEEVQKHYSECFNIPGKTVSMQFRHRHKDGTYRWLESVGTNYFSDPNLEAIVATSKEITEQKNAEKLIITQRDLGLKINSITNLDELYSISIDALHQATGMECGGIYMFDKEGRNLDLIYSVGLSEQFCEATSHYDEHSDNVKFSKTCNPAFIEYAQMPVKLGDIEQKENLQSFVLLPLINKDKAVGCINLASRKHIAIPIQQQKGVETIAVLVANALERIRNEEEIRNINASLEIKVEERTGQLAEANEKLQEEIEERVHTEEQLKNSEEKHRTLFETMVQGVIYQDSEGIAFDENSAAERILGLSLEQLQGRKSIDPRWKAIHEDGTDFPGEDHPPMIALRTGKKVENVVMGIFNPKLNEHVWLNVNSTPQFREGEEKPYRVYSTFEDITERRNAETEIKKAKLEAERANLAKSEFLSRMSHELRTPMNSILGFAQLMNMGKLKPAHKKGVDHILKSGKHLLDLINEVLDLSRIEAGELTISLEPVPVRGIVSETMDVVKLLATEKNITFEFPESPVCDLFVKADRQKLKQVLLNLLSNAVKYNRESGSVRVECVTDRRQNAETRLIASVPSPAASRPTIRISIIDTGKGIAPEYMERLFNPFERVGAEVSEVEGTGLGLAVSKKLIEAMHGTIGVESEPVVGSTFWIELPQAEGQVDHHERKGSFIRPETESVVSGTLLYIEDNVSNIQLVEQILGMHRPQIRLITEMYGKRTVQLATDYKPDLILLDLDLPDIHGSEVLKLLRVNNKTKSIPVVVLSADAMNSQIQKLLKSGAKDYLTKPIDVLEFLRVVDEMMKAPF